MASPLLSLFGLAALPPQASSRMAPRQERPTDNEQKHKQRQRQDERPRPDAANDEQIGSHIDTTA